MASMEQLCTMFELTWCGPASNWYGSGVFITARTPSSTSSSSTPTTAPASSGTGTGGTGGSGTAGTAGRPFDLFDLALVTIIPSYVVFDVVLFAEAAGVFGPPMLSASAAAAPYTASIVGAEASTLGIIGSGYSLALINRSRHHLAPLRSSQRPQRDRAGY
jgi:hypothetical protein